MKLPMTRETTGWATSVTRSHVSRPSRRVQDAGRDRADLVLVLGDPLRGEPRWNRDFRRSCFGGSIPMNIAEMSSSGMIASVSAVMPLGAEE